MQKFIFCSQLMFEWVHKLLPNLCTLAMPRNTLVNDFAEVSMKFGRKHTNLILPY